MHRPAAVLATVLTTFALTSTASAASYCVAPATGCDHTASSLQDALTQAGDTAGEDTIRLGAATYSATAELTYTAGDGARVTIEGIDTLQTVIARSTAPSSAITLNASSPITLENLQVQAAGGSSPKAVLATAGLTTDQVYITDAAGATGSPTGIEVSAGGVLDNVNVDISGNGACINGSGAQRLDVRHSVLQGCAIGVNAT